MGALRNFLRGNRGIVALVMALALAMKALVPAGYMLDRGAAGPGVILCSGSSLLAQAQAGVLAGLMERVEAGKSASGGADHSGGGDGQGAGEACPYSVLPMAMLAGADLPLLAAALAFILLLGFAAVPPPRLARSSHLRPPLRGPPALV